MLHNLHFVRTVPNQSIRCWVRGWFVGLALPSIYGDCANLQLSSFHMQLVANERLGDGVMACIHFAAWRQVCVGRLNCTSCEPRSE